MDELAARRDAQTLEGGAQARERPRAADRPPQEPQPSQRSSGGGAILSGAAVASLARRARKGFGTAGTSKKRLVLTLEDDAADDDGGGSNNNNRRLEAGPEVSESPASASSDSVPWWKLEYQRPPPGHLGAHVVPVAEARAASLPQRMGECSTVSVLAKLQATAEQQRPTANDSPGARKRQHWSHETPERAHRRARGDALALIPSLQVDSSPTQKRKIRHVRESEARGLRLVGERDGVSVKERQWFHHDSIATSSGDDAELVLARLPVVVTPSRLVQPLNEIEIASDGASGKAAVAADRLSASARREGGGS